MPKPVLNNPYELGKPSFDILEAALQGFIDKAESEKRLLDANEARGLLGLIQDSYTIWLDLNSEQDE